MSMEQLGMIRELQRRVATLEGKIGYLIADFDSRQATIKAQQESRKPTLTLPKKANGI